MSRHAAASVRSNVNLLYRGRMVASEATVGGHGSCLLMSISLSALRDSASDRKSRGHGNDDICTEELLASTLEYGPRREASTR
jgi:hypothetical protein